MAVLYNPQPSLSATFLPLLKGRRTKLHFKISQGGGEKVNQSSVLSMYANFFCYNDLAKLEAVFKSCWGG